MAVQKKTLKAAIKDAFTAELDNVDSQTRAVENIAEAVAAAVCEQIVRGINTAEVSFLLSTSMGPVTGTITIKAEIGE